VVQQQQHGVAGGDAVVFGLLRRLAGDARRLLGKGRSREQRGHDDKELDCHDVDARVT